MIGLCNLRQAARSIRLVMKDESGATLMEFGILASTFIILLIGLFDVGQLAYAQSILNGAVHEAARESSLESGDTTAADAKVTEMVRYVIPGATVTSSRLSYYDFSDVGRPERWDDGDSDGSCNNGENYTDENGNGSWDADVGSAGNGDANDVVIYDVTVSYTPSFAMPLVPSTNGIRTLEATSVKKNQPFADQDGYGSDAGVC